MTQAGKAPLRWTSADIELLVTDGWKRDDFIARIKYLHPCYLGFNAPSKASSEHDLNFALPGNFGQ